ncbi:DNA polymerase-3 subunit beta [Porphyromonadaceae bacterium KH3CP3RA]|nr:DNA polymerase-3 subunit beta [Porphyromonadaceae bacterium KH3CP3RA]
MKISVTKSELLSRLRVVSKVLKSSAKEAMYSTFLIRVENEKSISITAMDEAGRITTTLECAINDFQETSFLLDAQTLMRALSELPDQPIEITIDPLVKVTFKYFNGKFEMAPTDAIAYPDLPAFDKELPALSSSLLSKGFKTVSKYASDDQLRPVMTSVNVSSNDGRVAFAGTDGHVLAVYEDDVPEIPFFNLNVPARYAKIISEMLPADDTMIQMFSSGNSVKVVIGEYSVIYRLIEGSYVNYRRVIPANPDMKMNIDCQELISAINRVSVFSSSASSMISLNIKDNILKITAEDIDYSRKADEELMLNSVLGKLVIGFRAQFLADVLKTISVDSKACDIHFSGPQTSAIFRPEGSEKVTIIIVPMIVNQ